MLRSTPLRSLALFAAGTVVGYLALAQTAAPAPAMTPAAPAASSTPASAAPATPAAPSATQPAAPAAKVPTVSGVIQWKDMVVRPTNVGERRDLWDVPTQTLDRFESHITTVNVGQQAHPPHRHAHEELLLVKEGTLEVSIDGQTYVAPPGALIYYASNSLHGTRNIGDTPATYYVFTWYTAKTPRPGATPPANSAPAVSAPARAGSP